MKVTNRSKGLDLKDRVSDELWTEVHGIVQEAGIRPSQRKRNAKRQNGCLRRSQIAEKRREVKGKGEKKDIPI